MRLVSARNFIVHNLSLLDDFMYNTGHCALKHHAGNTEQIYLWMRYFMIGLKIRDVQKIAENQM